MFLFRFHSSIEGDSDSFWQLSYYFSVGMKFLRFYSIIFGDGNMSSFDRQADIFGGGNEALRQEDYVGHILPILLEMYL